MMVQKRKAIGSFVFVRCDKTSSMQHQVTPMFLSLVLMAELCSRVSIDPADFYSNMDLR
jgi:hypothetical protein